MEEKSVLDSNPEKPYPRDETEDDIEEEEQPMLCSWISYNLTCYVQFINCLNQPAETGVNIRSPEERIHL